jgi:hypothetical protein
LLYTFFHRCENPHMKRVVAAMAVVAILAGLAGCLPTAKNPLSDPSEALVDMRLDGLWYGKSGDDTIFLHFVAGKSNTMDLVEVDHEKTGDAHTSIYTMFPTVIDGVRYLNIREKGAGEKPYYFARYALSKAGTLSIWLMSESPVAKAVNDGKLTGNINVKEHADGTSERNIALTGSTEALAAFVHKSDPDVLFAEKFGAFRKVTLPALPAETATPTPTPTPKAKASPTPKHKKKAASQ